MRDQIEELAQLTDALYEAELNKMRLINAREARLRRDLAELENLRRRNQDLPTTQLNSVRQLGGDVLWQGWLARTREDLNTQLALVLAQKANLQAGLRRAFGKHVAAKEMLKEQTKVAKSQLNKRSWQKLEVLALLTQREF